MKGYYRYFNEENKSCLIKFDRSFIKCKYIKPFEIIVKFKINKDDEWKYYIPHTKFQNVFEIIQHLLDNLENDKVIFKITKI